MACFRHPALPIPHILLCVRIDPAPCADGKRVLPMHVFLHEGEFHG